MAAIVTGVDIALTLLARALAAAQSYNALILQARKEGRDISPEELATAQAESEAATKDAAAALDAAAQDESGDTDGP